MPKTAISEFTINNIRLARWRCRTDLVYLCQKILDYPNVEKEMHGPILDVLQQFPKPTGTQAIEHDKWNGNGWDYKPLVEMYSLPGKRRALILFPRSTLKTTANILGHTIQWQLNYPDISIAIFQSNLDKAIDLVKEIKRHFQYNRAFRQLFPEHCPPEKKSDDFGTQSQFVLPSRKRGRKEPTLVGLSLEKGATGMHFDVMKFTDIVEEENVKNSDRIFAIKKSFYTSEPLLVTPASWIDVEGTRYHEEDLYGELIEKWLKEKKEGKEPKYNVAVSSCWKRKFPDKPFYTPDSLTLPFDKDSEGKLISIWPKDNEGKPRLTHDYLLELKKDHPYTYSTQYLNTPEGGIGGVEIFEVSYSRPQVMPVDIFYSNTNFHIVSRVLSIDTAQTKQEYSNNSALAIGAWGTDGRCYVEDIQVGKWLPSELVEVIVNMIKKYKPHRVFIEKTNFVTGFMLGLMPALQRAGIFVPIEEVTRATTTKKIERIQNSLQPWYKSGNMRFVLKEEGSSADSPFRGGIDTVNWEKTLKEFRSFPKGSDDILDALSDLFTGKTYFGKLSSDSTDNRTAAELEHSKKQIEAELRQKAFVHMIENGATQYVKTPWDITGGL